MGFPLYDICMKDGRIVSIDSRNMAFDTNFEDFEKVFGFEVTEMIPWIVTRKDLKGHTRVKSLDTHGIIFEDDLVGYDKYNKRNQELDIIYYKEKKPLGNSLTERFAKAAGFKYLAPTGKMTIEEFIRAYNENQMEFLNNNLAALEPYFNRQERFRHELQGKYSDIFKIEILEDGRRWPCFSGSRWDKLCHSKDISNHWLEEWARRIYEKAYLLFAL
ncbi:Uncharacterised protein [uncultured archaeon]|nr:Uncharacterised protein [uncultured archaeon]